MSHSNSISVLFVTLSSLNVSHYEIQLDVWPCITEVVTSLSTLKLF